VFVNCRTYNLPASPIGKAGRRLQAAFQRQVRTKLSVVRRFPCSFLFPVSAFFRVRAIQPNPTAMTVSCAHANTRGSPLKPHTRTSRHRSTPCVWRVMTPAPCSHCRCDEYLPLLVIAIHTPGCRARQVHSGSRVEPSAAATEGGGSRKRKDRY
jgi:hypothetical protein